MLSQSKGSASSTEPPGFCGGFRGRVLSAGRARRSARPILGWSRLPPGFRHLHLKIVSGPERGPRAVAAGRSAATAQTWRADKRRARTCAVAPGGASCFGWKPFGFCRPRRMRRARSARRNRAPKRVFSHVDAWAGRVPEANLHRRQDRRHPVLCLCQPGQDIPSKTEARTCHPEANWNLQNL